MAYDERPCDLCGRPLWDGSHSINEQECTKPGNFECRLIEELTSAKKQIEELRQKIKCLTDDLRGR